jgi:hypothetical protein
MFFFFFFVQLRATVLVFRLVFLAYLLRPSCVVTANNFPYPAFNVTVPLSDAAYEEGCKEGDVSYIRPASTFTNMKELVTYSASMSRRRTLTGSL